MKHKRHSQPIIDFSLHVSRPHHTSLFLIYFTQSNCLFLLLPSALCTAITRPARQSCALRGNHAPFHPTIHLADSLRDCPKTTYHTPGRFPPGLPQNHPTIHLADSLRDCPKTTQPYTWQIPSGIALAILGPLADSHRDCPNHHITADSLRDCSSHL